MEVLNPAYEAGFQRRISADKKGKKPFSAGSKCHIITLLVLLGMFVVVLIGAVILVMTLPSENNVVKESAGSLSGALKQLNRTEADDKAEDHIVIEDLTNRLRLVEQVMKEFNSTLKQKFNEMNAIHSEHVNLAQQNIADNSAEQVQGVEEIDLLHHMHQTSTEQSISIPSQVDNSTNKSPRVHITTTSGTGSQRTSAAVTETTSKSRTLAIKRSTNQIISTPEQPTVSRSAQQTTKRTDVTPTLGTSVRTQASIAPLTFPNEPTMRKLVSIDSTKTIHRKTATTNSHQSSRAPANKTDTTFSNQVTTRLITASTPSSSGITTSKSMIPTKTTLNDQFRESKGLMTGTLSVHAADTTTGKILTTSVTDISTLDVEPTQTSFGGFTSETIDKTTSNSVLMVTNSNSNQILDSKQIARRPPVNMLNRTEEAKEKKLETTTASHITSTQVLKVSTALENARNTTEFIVHSKSMEPSTTAKHPTGSPTRQQELKNLEATNEIHKQVNTSMEQLAQYELKLASLLGQLELKYESVTQKDDVVANLTARCEALSKKEENQSSQLLVELNAAHRQMEKQNILIGELLREFNNSKQEIVELKEMANSQNDLNKMQQKNVVEQNLNISGMQENVVAIKAQLEGQEPNMKYVVTIAKKCQTQDMRITSLVEDNTKMANHISQQDLQLTILRDSIKDIEHVSSMQEIQLEELTSTLTTAEENRSNETNHFRIWQRQTECRIDNLDTEAKTTAQNMSVLEKQSSQQTATLINVLSRLNATEQGMVDMRKDEAELTDHFLTIQHFHSNLNATIGELEEKMAADLFDFQNITAAQLDNLNISQMGKNASDLLVQVKRMQKDCDENVQLLDGFNNKLSEMQSKMNQQGKDMLQVKLQVNKTSLEAALLVSSVSELSSKAKSCDGAQPAQPEKASCMNGYTLNPNSNTCYKLFNSNTNWDGARRFCQSEGGDLATFETTESASWILQQTRSNAGFKVADGAWIGAKKVNNQWTWVGKAKGILTYSSGWAPRQPDNDGSCLELLFDDGYNDGPCHWNHRGLVCEKP